MPAPVITILLADDHAVVRSGFRHLLAAQWDMSVVAEAASGTEALKLAEQHRPQVAVLDVTMPGLNGIETTRRLPSVSPQTSVLALSMHKDAVYVREMLRAGARGYLLKDCSETEFLTSGAGRRPRAGFSECRGLRSGD
jgi:DNA-binding NarL/FixJ family response regulator